MVDGSALLTTPHHGYVADGWWVPRRESNLLDGAAPFYTTYQTADGEHVAVGALEPQFFAALLAGLEIDPAEFASQNAREQWPAMRARFAGLFSRRTRDEWAEHFAGTDACVAPVMSLTDAPAHPHNRARSTFVEIDGVIQPGPAPRFGSTTAEIRHGPSRSGADTDEVLAWLGFSPADIGKLRDSGAVA
jgi:alpha-methylacyl-CoA racemase